MTRTEAEKALDARQFVPRWAIDKAAEYVADLQSRRESLMREGFSPLEIQHMESGAYGVLGAMGVSLMRDDASYPEAALSATTPPVSDGTPGTINIQHGKRYRTRRGDVFHVVAHKASDGSSYAFARVADTDWLYTAEGRFWTDGLESELDLIEEVREDALAEVGVSG